MRASNRAAMERGMGWATTVALVSLVGCSIGSGVNETFGAASVGGNTQGGTDSVGTDGSGGSGGSADDTDAPDGSGGQEGATSGIEQAVDEPAQEQPVLVGQDIADVGEQPERRDRYRSIGRSPGAAIFQ